MVSISYMRSIEFIGLPGVGKTTLSKGVVKFLQRKLPVTVLTPEKASFYVAKDHCEMSLRKILLCLPETLGQRLFNLLGGRTFWQQEFIIAYILENHKLLQTILDAPRLNKPSDHEFKVVFNGLLQSGGLFTCLKQNSKNDWWILFDEGMIQKSMMFVSSHGTVTQEVVEQFLSQLILPDVIVNLHIDKNTCIERMVGRSKGVTSRLRTHSREQIEAFLDHSIEHWEVVTSWLKENTNIPILNIRTEQNQQELISYLGMELEKIIRGGIK